MSEHPTFKPGAFCWIDLMTRDTAAAKAFYGALMGWSAQDIALGPNAAYTMLKKGDRPAAGMVAASGEMQGAPPCWMSHVYVTDIDALAERARSLGGTVRAMGEAGDKGRFAVVADPTGAVFVMWQPNGELDTVVGEAGTLVWNELWTPDMEKAAAFYTGLFGWTSRPMPASHPYVVFENEGRACGGMMTLPEDAAKMGAPPVWMVYLGADDVDASIEKATSLGARVLCPATDIPDIGRFSVLSDPQGAAFAVFKMTGAA